MKSRLYADFKFYRFCQIKSFLLIRHFKIAKKGSDEHKVYSNWVINFISNLNPDYTKVTYFNDSVDIHQLNSNDIEELYDWSFRVIPQLYSNLMVLRQRQVKSNLKVMGQTT